MSNFDAIIKPILRNEGGYSNVTGDTGGETYRGISRNNFPKWEGWSVVDKNQPLKDEQIIKDPNLDAMVNKFYKVNFYLTNKLDQVNSDEIAQKIMDMCVNMGSNRGIKLTQKAVVNCGIHIEQDGKPGHMTVRGINSLDVHDLKSQLIKVSVDFYNSLVVAKPSQAKFLKGWLNRANQ